MAMDILVGIICVVAVCAGVWVWRMENGNRNEGNSHNKKS